MNFIGHWEAWGHRGHCVDMVAWSSAPGINLWKVVQFIGNADLHAATANLLPVLNLVGWTQQLYHRLLASEKKKNFKSNYFAKAGKKSSEFLKIHLRAHISIISFQN